MPDNWRSVELKHLRALSAVARLGSFWAASEELKSSLSTVSDHIAALEALIGQRLIERSRGRRTVRLTEAGRLLQGHADAIEARLHAAQADFRVFAAGRSGSLRVGIYQSVANKVLPEVMRRFKEGWPDVDLQVFEAGQDDELVGEVESGDLDLSFAVQPVPEGPFEVRELMRDPYVLVTSAGLQFSRRRPSVADLAGLPMVGFQHGRTEDLSEPVPPRVLVVIWHRDRYRPPSADAFVETAVAVARDIEREHEAFMGRAARAKTRARGRRPRLPESRPV